MQKGVTILRKIVTVLLIMTRIGTPQAYTIAQSDGLLSIILLPCLAGKAISGNVEEEEGDVPQAAASSDCTLRQILEYSAASTRVLSAKYAGALRRAWPGIGHGRACPCSGASGGCRLLGRGLVVQGRELFGKCTKSFFCLDVLLFVRFERSPLSSGWLFGKVLCLWLHSVFRHGVLSGLEPRACPERLPQAAGAVWPGGYFFVSSHKS